jgi:hypothetical protein
MMRATFEAFKQSKKLRVTGILLWLSMLIGAALYFCLYSPIAQGVLFLITAASIPLYSAQVSSAVVSVIVLLETIVLAMLYIQTLVTIAKLFFTDDPKFSLPPYWKASSKIGCMIFTLFLARMSIDIFLIISACSTVKGFALWVPIGLIYMCAAFYTLNKVYQCFCLAVQIYRDPSKQDGFFVTLHQKDRFAFTMILLFSVSFLLLLVPFLQSAGFTIPLSSLQIFVGIITLGMFMVVVPYVLTRILNVVLSKIYSNRGIEEHLEAQTKCLGGYAPEIKVKELCHQAESTSTASNQRKTTAVIPLPQENAEAQHPRSGAVASGVCKAHA